jgi:hypothetical protein
MATPNFDLSDPLLWNLVRRSSLSNNGDPLPSQSFTVDSLQLVVGIYIPNVKPTWNYAGQLLQYVPQLPSSTAIAYTALTRVGRFPLALKSYQGIELINALPRPFVCSIEFPSWFTAVELEIWQRLTN